MHKDDLMQVSLHFIMGALYDEEQVLKQFTNKPREFMDFAYFTHARCWKYCMRQVNTGGFSDRECNLAIKMDHAFRSHFDKVIEEDKKRASEIKEEMKT